MMEYRNKFKDTGAIGKNVLANGDEAGKTPYKNGKVNDSLNPTIDPLKALKQEATRIKMEAAFKEVNDQAAKTGTVDAAKWRQANKLADEYWKTRVSLEQPKIDRNQLTGKAEARINIPKNQKVSGQSTQTSELYHQPSLIKDTQQLSQAQNNRRVFQKDAIGSGVTQAPTRIKDTKLVNTANSFTKRRGFIDTIINDPNTTPKVKNNLTSLYSVRNTEQLQTKAANLVKSDLDTALKVAKSDTSALE